MHVALVSPAWPLEKYPNGIVTYVDWMRQGLALKGHRVTVIASMSKGSEDGVERVVASTLTRARGWLDSKTLPPHAAAFAIGRAISDTIRALHRRVPVDVVETEESFGWCEDIARRTSLPTVVKLHGPAFLSLVEEELDTPFAVAKIAREGEALRRAKTIISPAQRTLEQTVARYGLSPAVARHIVNPLVLPPTAPIWSFDRCDPKTLLFVGRFDKRKGGDIVLQAFARLLASDPGLKLVFVGSDPGIDRAGTDPIHAEAMAEELLPGTSRQRFDYKGVLPPEQIYPLRAQAALTVIASRWENQSYTALEAMLQGCPIVSSDAGGQPEIVRDGETGLLAAAGSAVDLADKIRVLLDDPMQAARLGRQAREYALRHHSPEAVVTQTLEVYREAIAAVRSPRRP